MLKKIISAIAVVFLLCPIGLMVYTSGMKVGPDHHVMVDGAQDLRTMLNAVRYDRTDHPINRTINQLVYSEFDSSAERGKKEETIVIVSFRTRVSSEEAIRKMYIMGLRPANLREYIAYNGTDKDLSNHKVVCLGSAALAGSRLSRNGFRYYVPILSEENNGRYRTLEFENRNNEWSSSYRFLAVRGIVS